MRNASRGSTLDGDLHCHVSEDSILDYGQYVILSTGNFLCSAPTLNLSMDFSIKYIEDGVVNSPPNKKSLLLVSCSPSPLHSRGLWNLSMSPTVSDKGTQIKLYGDANHLMSTPEVKPSVPDEECLGNGALAIVPLTLPHSRA